MIVKLAARTHAKKTIRMRKFLYNKKLGEKNTNMKENDIHVKGYVTSL